MKLIAKIFSLLPLVFLTSLVVTVPVLAFPPLPSSFYGTVKVNGANVPDGTVVQALIDDIVYAQGLTQTYEGTSVFVLDVPGDDTDSATSDGGKSGDTIQFKIGGILAEQTGTWQSGTNINLNLTASSTEQIAPPQPTPSPVPTQTSIVVVVQPTPVPTKQPTQSTSLAKTQSSPIPTTNVESSPVSAVELESSDVPENTNPSSGGGVVNLLPSVTSAPAGEEKHDSSGNLTVVLAAGAVLFSTTILGYLLWPPRKKKM